jgi:hypothetical protein
MGLAVQTSAGPGQPIISRYCKHGPMTSASPPTSRLYIRPLVRHIHSWALIYGRRGPRAPAQKTS